MYCSARHRKHAYQLRRQAERRQREARVQARLVAGLVVAVRDHPDRAARALSVWAEGGEDRRAQLVSLCRALAVPESSVGVVEAEGDVGTELGRLRSFARRKAEAAASWERNLRACAGEARAAGASWRQVGAALGISESVARFRFGAPREGRSA